MKLVSTITDQLTDQHPDQHKRNHPQLKYFYSTVTSFHTLQKWLTDFLTILFEQLQLQAITMHTLQLLSAPHTRRFVCKLFEQQQLQEQGPNAVAATSAVAANKSSFWMKVLSKFNKDKDTKNPLLVPQTPSEMFADLIQQQLKQLSKLQEYRFVVQGFVQQYLSPIRDEISQPHVPQSVLPPPRRPRPPRLPPPLPPVQGDDNNDDDEEAKQPGDVDQEEKDDIDLLPLNLIDDDDDDDDKHDVDLKEDGVNALRIVLADASTLNHWDHLTLREVQQKSVMRILKPYLSQLQFLNAYVSSRVFMNLWEDAIQQRRHMLEEFEWNLPIVLQEIAIKQVVPTFRKLMKALTTQKLTVTEMKKYFQV